MEYYYTNGEETVENRLEVLETQLEFYEESYNDAAKALAALENVGWNLYSGIIADEGFDILQLKDVSKQLREWSDTNPLLFRGHEIRCSYMFGTGYQVGTTGTNSKISQRILDIVNKEVNLKAVFAGEALGVNERSRFTDGAVFVTYDKKKQQFQRQPLARINDVATDPDNVETKWFYQLIWERQTLRASDGQRVVEPIRVWYPTDTALATGSGAPKPRVINGDKVDYNFIMIDDIINEHTGNVWGLPDAFTAAPWALAYSAYLRDGTKVLASLAEWAWKLSPKSNKGGDAAGAKVKTSTGASGGTIITDMDVQSLPRGNAVDLTTGRPLAAQVASALGVSVVILLSDPGTSGAFGTAQTLTDPSLRTMLNRQKLNTKFLKRCLLVLGVKDPEILWEKMNPDADYREMQTINAALGTGLFHADEVRPQIAKLAGINLLHDTEPDGYLDPNNAKSWERADIDPKDGPASSVKPDGTTSLTNGQGKKADPTAKPSHGVNDLRKSGGRND